MLSTHQHSQPINSCISIKILYRNLYKDHQSYRNDKQTPISLSNKVITARPDWKVCEWQQHTLDSLLSTCQESAVPQVPLQTDWRSPRTPCTCVLLVIVQSLPLNIQRKYAAWLKQQLCGWPLHGYMDAQDKRLHWSTFSNQSAWCIYLVVAHRIRAKLIMSRLHTEFYLTLFQNHLCSLLAPPLTPHLSKGQCFCLGS